MNVFELRRQVVGDYSDYVRSFIRVLDPRISTAVNAELNGGLLWPEPLIQLNPSFEPGEHVDELVAKGVLHKGCDDVFRKDKSDSDRRGKRLRLHRHQADAILRAKQGENYVLTTGTGSGKSLSYIVPIVDHVLQRGSGRGIQAIVVYPMNALANSQFKELTKFLKDGFPDGRGPVTFERYTGQESDEQKKRIIASPPDILLTNYVMLELILTRPAERNLIDRAKGLRFLVFDELHTYRGRQGADVALLMRRVRDRLGAEDLLCVGTSATLSSKGTQSQQRAEVARVATQLFGTAVKPESVIGETLKRATPALDFNAAPAKAALAKRVTDTKKRPPDSAAAFVEDPLSSWIESTFGVRPADDEKRLIRSRPRRIGGEDGAAVELSKLTGATPEVCVAAIQETLLAGYRVQNPETGFPIFAFRLHQFISKGDTVYATVEPEDRRHITFQVQKFVPGDRSRRLLPLAFCRECGQEYYVVQKNYDAATGQVSFEPRELLEKMEDGAGYLYLSAGNPWPESIDAQHQRVPEDWLEERNGKVVVRDARRGDMPVSCRVSPAATEDKANGLMVSFLDGTFRFCLACGVSYSARQRSEFGKLTALGSEGRSTATTILSLSAIRHLKRDQALPEKAKKLLSFTDNRQDASLQAGHFNDFIDVGLLRSALFKACVASKGGITHEVLTEKVFAALDLPLSLYAIDPGVKYQAKADTEKALRDVLGYRLYRDLRRGWRVTSPNLEQCGLLELAYNSLDDVCRDEEVWKEVPLPGGKKSEPVHPVLQTASPDTRARLAKVLLDYMRRELCIKVEYLREDAHDRIRQQSSQKLKEPWGIDEQERLERASVLYPRSGKPNDRSDNVYLSARGGFGQFLGRANTFPEWNQGKLKLDDRQDIIRHLLEALRVAGLVERVDEPKDDVPGYQVPASAFRWLAGDGTKVALDPIRVPTPPKEGARSNDFFVAFYKAAALDAVGLIAREHTAQVPSDKREERENSFREGSLPILYCSPTMELGVDISELNVVNLRNIPPTPANYAQRSGRAGRSGQPALVVSYCSTNSQHDQYFFKRPDNMVAGSVAPPRLDLANEELIRSHIHAIWLAETEQSLGGTLKDLLDLTSGNKELPLLASVRETMSYPLAQERARKRAENVLASLQGDLAGADWWEATWLDESLRRTLEQFDGACRRWRTLYTSAVRQRDLQTAIINDVSRSYDDKQQAQRLRREAEAQIELLTEPDTISQSDFYSYRYFASEGFLPGYNFPRLPLSAYLPGRQMRTLKGTKDNYLSRPRFLAISEFGPRAIVYHEGSRYLINRVILPVDDRGVITVSAKQCTACGYLHPIQEGIGPDTCERCRAVLPQPIQSLFRLQNVSTKRRDKINSDEEERLRLGYELRTAVRFEPRDNAVRAKTAEVVADGTKLASLTYGHAATIWRINLGWKRRKNKNELGFWLDEERGYWSKNDLDDDDKDDPMSTQKKRVIPYVEDHRNCLLFQPETALPAPSMATLQAALKNAIQVEFQLEENELAAEPLPTLGDRRQILLYEASEGGAGVLRRLVEDADVIGSVAKRALALLHFDPETGADRRRAEGAREDCEAACYDCLMSYTNQGDHELLDRKLLRDTLMSFAKATVKVAPGAISRAEHLKQLMNLADSDLEKRWLRMLDQQNLKLPSSAQRLFEAAKTRPDFIYDEERAAVYVDGPPHDFPERAARDKAAQEAMEDDNWLVIRFSHTDDWSAVIAKFPRIFGKTN
jgi:ATP-dependent helicase YprA (DUF1998 family)/very-short-patch-repair endonuclease